MGYVYIALTVIFTVYGQLIIKHEVNVVQFPDTRELLPFLLGFVFRPLVLSGLASAVLASLAWMAALSRFELSFAYPFMSLSFVIVLVLSIMMFGENLNAYKIAGIAMICAGVWIVSLGS